MDFPIRITVLGQEPDKTTLTKTSRVGILRETDFMGIIVGKVIVEILEGMTSISSVEVSCSNLNYLLCNFVLN